ncbi:MAG: TFIIB-type zinc ribbon-containing protein [Nanoarchaeota archaeon]
MDGKIGILKECPDCAGTNVVYVESRDQLVCRDCGLVFEPLVPDVEEEFEKTHNLNLGLAKVSKSKKLVVKKKKR